MNKNRIVVFLLFLGAMATLTCLGYNRSGNYIEFRLILHPSEISGKQVESIDKDGRTLYVWKLAYLTERDVKKAQMVRSITSPGSVFLSIEFNEDGKRRLYRFTKKFANEDVGIFVEGKLIGLAEIKVPIFVGDVVVISWPGTEEELKDFTKRINTDIATRMKRYSDEQNRLDVLIEKKFDEVYKEINKYIDIGHSQSQDQPDVFDGVGE